nr:[FeFe] hydrogenase H-cluster radical SAM maturase HydE [uncultured Peptostreptococcus sp.]
MDKKVYKLINQLYCEHNLGEEDLTYIIKNMNEEIKEYLVELAYKTRNKYYGKFVYLRGLIEYTNFCKRECKYCGINAYNKSAKRYRMNKFEIIDTCRLGYNLGFRTFVLQGGEDPYFTDKRICDIVKSIKKIFPDVAITLSLGEREEKSYRAMKEAGADRFLLRHETANPKLYRWLHPFSNLDSRLKCLNSLKQVGFQTGAGFMVGLPWYTDRDYARDLVFLKELKPEMIGIGPFIPHSSTSMKDYEPGSLDKTIVMLALLRLLLPKVLLPATTALASIGACGRKYGLDAGANVIMPNLTPLDYRGDYSLYNNKKSTGSESAESLNLIKQELESYGYMADMSRGDSKMCD